MSPESTSSYNVLAFYKFKFLTRDVTLKTKNISLFNIHRVDTENMCLRVI